jgi:predicted nucleic acid-binding protein
LSNFFVDTSGLGRRYLTEIGSTWVLSWILPPARHVVLIAELSTVELLATFARLQRQGLLSAGQVTTLQNNFLLHIEQEYLTVLIDRAIIAQARALVGKHKLRTLDAIQLASALDAFRTLGEPMTFISGDNDLLTAATAEGFPTDNPYKHP